MTLTISKQVVFPEGATYSEKLEYIENNLDKEFGIEFTGEYRSREDGVGRFPLFAGVTGVLGIKHLDIQFEEGRDKPPTVFRHYIKFDDGSELTYLEHQVD